MKNIKIRKAFQEYYNLGKETETFIMSSREEVVKQGRTLAEGGRSLAACLQVAN